MVFEIEVNKVENSRISEVDFNNIQFGKIFSDHQFSVDYNGTEWTNAQIIPYGKISMSPAISAIHYGQSIFEGMKAFKDSTGNPQLFRPLDNARRLNTSAKRMHMPEIPEELFMHGLRALVDIDRDWIPTSAGSALYLRPFMFATDDFIGVRPSTTYKFMIFSCPVGAYYSKPISVKAETHYIRAAKGGTGSTKCAGNYGAVMHPAALAQSEGYNQVLWLDAENHQSLEETGTTNVFVRIGDTLITPSLNGGTILAGITRDSILSLANYWGYKTEEREIHIDELFEAKSAGKLKEIFASGTAATVAKIERVHYRGIDLVMEDLDNWTWCNRFKSGLEAIKTGREEDPFGWVVKL